MNASEEAYVKSLENKVAHLTEQLEWLKRQVFGKKSEKVVPHNEDQLVFEGFGKLQAPEDEKQAVPSHQRKKRKKDKTDAIQIPKDLPIEQTVIDVPDKEKVCPETGKPLVKIGEEVSSKLAHRPGSFFIKQIVRPKYGLPKGEGVVCAELPDSLLPRCLADESLLAEVLVTKFSDHLPLYRSEEIFKRHRIGISRQLLSQWVIQSSFALKPLYDRMRMRILESGNVFIDESPVSMLAPGTGKTHKAYMWVVAGNDLCAFDFRENRKHKIAGDILKDFQGTFHSDKYGAYEELAQKPHLTWCPCWGHIRRKFFEAESGDPAFRKWMLRHIRYLFMFERIALEHPSDKRLQIRKEKQLPLIDKMTDACQRKLIDGRILPKSKLRTALGYFCGLIPYLKNYAVQPDARLDNNTAERAIRPLAIGRKNWLFVGNSRGGEAAAIALSLIQSCRSLGVNPREYLEDVMHRIMGHPVNKLDELLPDNWAKEQAD